MRWSCHEACPAHLRFPDTRMETNGPQKLLYSSFHPSIHYFQNSCSKICRFYCSAAQKNEMHALAWKAKDEVGIKLLCNLLLGRLKCIQKCEHQGTNRKKGEDTSDVRRNQWKYKMDAQGCCLGGRCSSMPEPKNLRNLSLAPCALPTLSFTPTLAQFCAWACAQNFSAVCSPVCTSVHQCAHNFSAVCSPVCTSVHQCAHNFLAVCAPVCTKLFSSVLLSCNSIHSAMSDRGQLSSWQKERCDARVKGKIFQRHQQRPQDVFLAGKHGFYSGNICLQFISIIQWH